jgi:CDP-4-dehydro-6-deoxyglucose reductase
MKEKEILRVEGPFGSFFLREDSEKDMVLLASGTGFAPIKAIIEDMIRKNSQRQGRSLLGLPLARRPLHARMGEEATRRLAHLRYIPVLSEPQARRRLDQAGPPRPPRRDARPAESVPAPGLRLRARRSCRVAQRDFIAAAALPDDEFYADSFTSEGRQARPAGVARTNQSPRTSRKTFASMTRTPFRQPLRARPPLAPR